MQVIKKEKRLIDVVVENYSICDKCGKEIKVQPYDAFEGIFEVTVGTSYPEGINAERHSLDLCQDCADIAIKLLSANGFKIQTKEIG